MDSVSIPLDVLEVYLVPLTPSDLSELAEAWQQNLKSALIENSDLIFAIQEASDENRSRLVGQLTERAGIQKSTVDKYAAVLAAWERKGATAEELAPYRQYLRGVRISTPALCQGSCRLV